jgi:hypothetical protein
MATLADETTFPPFTDVENVAEYQEDEGAPLVPEPDDAVLDEPEPDSVDEDAVEEEPASPVEPPSLILYTKDRTGAATVMKIVIKAATKSTHLESQLGQSAGAKSVTPSVTHEQDLSTDFTTLRDVADASFATTLLTDYFADDVQTGQLILLKPGEGIMTATTPVKKVDLDFGLAVHAGPPPEDDIFNYKLALVVTVPAEDLVKARQRALRCKVTEFTQRAAELGMTISLSLLAQLVGMDKATFLKNLNKEAAMDCKQLIKIERYLAFHTESDMAALQSAIDDVRPPTPATTGRRSRNDFNDAAKVLFSGALAGWRAAHSNERKNIVKELLASAQAAAVKEQLASAAWTEEIVTTALSNLLRRENKKARLAAQDEAQDEA